MNRYTPGCTCCGGCTISYGGSVTVCNSGGFGPAGATVTIKDHATGTVLDTRATTTGGSYSGSYSGTAGLVDVVVTLGNGTVTSASRSFVCRANTVPAMVIPVVKVGVSPLGCNGGIPGAVVSFVLSGVTTSVTCDSTGNATAYLKNGTYSYTVTAFRYATLTGSTSFNTALGCTPTFTPGLSPATGFVCWCGNRKFPVATTLNGSFLGASFALPYSSGSNPTWTSPLLTFTVPAGGAGTCCSVGGTTTGVLTFCKSGAGSYSVAVRFDTYPCVTGFGNPLTYTGTLTGGSEAPSFTEGFTITASGSGGVCSDTYTGTLTE